MANNMLAGDNTEDPEKPKIQWPSPQNCPTCKLSRNRWGRSLNENSDGWNMHEVLQYVKKVYGSNNIIDNLKKEERKDKIEEILSKMQKELGSKENHVFSKAKDDIMNYCRK